MNRRKHRVACSAAVVLAGAAAALPVQAQENRFELSARIVETYDTNVLRLGSGSISGPRDNLQMSPQIGVDYDRRFGRQRFFLNGTAGYVFNSRFRFLDREEINLQGGSNLRFGARCTVDPSSSFYRAQSDLEDLGDTIPNTATIQEHTIAAACPRPAGFYPTVSAGVLRVDNSGGRRQRDQTVYDWRSGLVYRRPSLGDAELFVQFVDIARRQQVPTASGLLQDATEVATVGLRLSRSVGTRIAASASLSYTNVDPQLPAVKGFSGLTYGGSASYQPQPNVTVTASAGRAISARGNVGTSYYINNTAGLAVTARLTARTRVGAGLEMSKRIYRGEDTSFVRGPRGTDRRLQASANASYAIAQPLSLTLQARYRVRDADNDFYDFDSFAATLGASFRL